MVDRWVWRRTGRYAGCSDWKCHTCQSFFIEVKPLFINESFNLSLMMSSLKYIGTLKHTRTVPGQQTCEWHLVPRWPAPPPQMQNSSAVTNLDDPDCAHRLHAQWNISPQRVLQVVDYFVTNRLTVSVFWIFCRKFWPMIVFHTYNSRSAALLIKDHLLIQEIFTGDVLVNEFCVVNGANSAAIRSQSTAERPNQFRICRLISQNTLRSLINKHVHSMLRHVVWSR